MKRSGIKRRPKKRSDVAAMADARDETLSRDNWECQFATEWIVAGVDLEPSEKPPPANCLGRLHVHHIQRRSQGGPNLPGNLITLCTNHHGWVHEHPKLAKAAGLLK